MVGLESLLPVVTVGASSVFCGRQRVLEALSVCEGHGSAQGHCPFLGRGVRGVAGDDETV